MRKGLAGKVSRLACKLALVWHHVNCVSMAMLAYMHWGQLSRALQMGPS